MPIKTLQKRLTEVGRLRLGHKEPVMDSRTGKQRVKDGLPVFRPARGEQWRLTSPDEDLLLHVAGIYGGDVKPWLGAPDGPEQWELLADSDTLHVLIPPGQAMSQWMESWRRGLCDRRCDGETEVMTGEPCLCAQETDHPKDYKCRPTTRLNVVLSDVPSAGVWRCELHGWYGATELLGMATLLEDAGLSGRIVPATLKIEQRTIPACPGSPTKRIVLPVLQPLPSFLQALALGGTQAAAQLQAPRPELPAPQDAPDRVGGDPQPPAHPVGSNASRMRQAQAEATEVRQRVDVATLPTLEQIQALKNPGAARALWERSSAEYQWRVQAAALELVGEDWKGFYRSAPIVDWQHVLTQALNAFNTSAVGGPPPTADPSAGAVQADGKAAHPAPADPNLLEGGETP